MSTQGTRTRTSWRNLGGLVILIACSAGLAAAGTGVVLFAAAIMTTILVHEAGHLLAARRFGMHCSRFFMGFGPTVYSWRTKSGLEVGVKALPLGGFVTISGMTHDQIRKMPATDRDGAYLTKSPWARIVVTLIGPVVNVALGAVMFVTVGAVWGLSTGAGQVVSVEEGSPAAQAGLTPGDTYTGRELNDDTLTFDVDGRGTVEVALPTDRQSLSSNAAAGLVVDQETTRSPDELFAFAGRSTWMVSSGTVKAIVSMPSAVMAAFTEDRQDAAMSVVGAAQFAGDVYSDENGGARLLALLLASLSVSIGVLNMAPLLPFDGGHAGLAFIDLVRSRVAAWRGREGAAPLDQTRFMQVTAVVMTIFIVTALALVVADITNPIRL